jgi:hypothetical protein
MPNPASQCIIAKPQELLGYIPFLTGFHPSNDVIVLFVNADFTIQVGTRTDLEPAGLTATNLLAVAAKLDVTAAVVIGYGPASAREQIATIAALVHTGLPVIGRFLMADRHCYCVLDGCDCPASRGLPVDANSTVTAAAMTAEGLVALQAQHDLLALAEPDPQAQQSIAAAITTTSTDLDSAQAALDTVLEQAKSGRRLTDDLAARLALALSQLNIRDQAWHATDKQMWLRDLWLDMTRRLPDDHVTPAANLAAWSAWRCGNEQLAHAALKRAITTDPANTMSALIAMLLNQHLPPSEIDWPIPAAQLTALHERSR